MLPTANPDVIVRNISGNAVLFHTADEVYYGLNPVGARIWELLPPASRTVDELCARLQDDYPEVAPEAIRADVLDLLSDLARNNLVTELPTCPDDSLPLAPSVS